MKTLCLSALLSATLLLGACACDGASSSKGSPASAGLVNTTCPFSGEALNDGSPSAEFQGKKIGFCCNNCLAKFNKLDDAGKAAKVANLK